MFHTIPPAPTPTAARPSPGDMCSVTHASCASLKDRLCISESQNKELRSALEDITQTLRRTQELLVFAISNLNRERAASASARRSRGVDSSRAATPLRSVADGIERLDIRKANCSTTQPTKLTIDYIMNNNDKSREDVKQGPLADELTYPENDNTCPYPSPPPTSLKHAPAPLEIPARDVIGNMHSPSSPDERRSIELVIPLISIPEPRRCYQWMQTMFTPDPSSEIGQVEFWTLYKDAFGAFAHQFPLVTAESLMQSVSGVFPGGQAIMAESGSVLMQRYVVRGVRRRF